ncbi:uncharacterized protein LOC133718335 isoform X2 [Rosa rugosa]|uniref:uncharacterized protein LOC133718335 isoform X2 n=1 Tax=Rosa rugosa TaxID=74645 RepID=UPI002B408527|nr:uncharacterized protein LOC133718335 isoform X2 [Rosa rugosa]
MTSSPAAKLPWLKSSLHFPAPMVRGPRGRSSGSKWRVRRSELELWSKAEVKSALVESSGGAHVNTEKKDKVNRTSSFCRFNLPFRCPTTSGLRGNSLTGALSPDTCQLTGLWYFDVRGNNLTGPASCIRSPKSIFTRMVGMERLGESFIRKVHDPSNTGEKGYN